MDIIIDAMIDNPGAVHRRGFQAALIRMFKKKPYYVEVDASYMCRLVKEARESLSRVQDHLYSKREYIMAHDRSRRVLKKALDIAVKQEKLDKIVNIVGADRQVLREQEQLEGHLADKISLDFGDEKIGKSLEELFDRKAGRPRKAKQETG